MVLLLETVPLRCNDAMGELHASGINTAEYEIWWFMIVYNMAPR